ncbi:histidine phosphatase family protein [Pseudoclavibacter helvolus]|uniref:histidine phosphatase family protein n=1 Tax=Pseudoclavibacter helvolus TaxID=255205 RepID=UPI003C75CCB6
MTLALVRHGRTAWNLERRLQGRSDIALDAHGELQAHAAGRLLARARWGRVVASPLTRAAQTAAIVGSHLDTAAPVLDPGLLERDFGEAEGMHVAEAAERWPSGEYPGSESTTQLGERAGAALAALLEGPGTAVIVSHGVFLRAGIEAITGAACPRILNGQVVLLEPTGGRPTARFLGE